MHISSGVHHKESCFKVTECISHQECIIREAVLKVRNAYHIRSASKGSCVKVKECISHQECIIGKVVLKLRNAYLINSAS